jgi:hypothetical protein
MIRVFLNWLRKVFSLDTGITKLETIIIGVLVSVAALSSLFAVSDSLAFAYLSVVSR